MYKFYANYFYRSNSKQETPRRSSFTSAASNNILKNATNQIKTVKPIYTYTPSNNTTSKTSTIPQRSSKEPLIVKVNENIDLPERFIKEEPNAKMTFKKVIPRERSSSISKIENKTSSLSTATNNNSNATTTTTTPNTRLVSTSKTIKTNPIVIIHPSPSQSPPTVDFTNSIQIPKNTEEDFLMKLNRRRNFEYKELKKIIKKQQEDDEMINEIINITADTTATVSTDFNGSDVLSLNDIDISDFHSPSKSKDKNDLEVSVIDVSNDNSFTSPIKNNNADDSVIDVDYSFSSPVNKVVNSIKNIDLEDNNKSVPGTPPTPQCKLPDEEKITYEMETAFQILMQSRRNACYKTILNITKI